MWRARPLVQTPYALAHPVGVNNECTWNDPAPLFYLQGFQNQWRFHTADGNCHVDGTLIAGATPNAWAAWYLPNSANYNHSYNAIANVACGGAAAHRAANVLYRMYISGSGGGYYTESRNQTFYCGNMSLDRYTFTATLGGQVRLVNTTGCPNCVGQTFQVDTMSWIE